MTGPEGIRVRDLMSGAPVTVHSETRVRDAIAQMNECAIGSVVVVAGGAPIGIFTERDLLRCSSGDRDGWDDLPVSELMTPNPITASVAERWDDAMDRMSEHGIRHLPVVERGRIVGMLAMRDIANHRTGVLESLVRERTSELELQNLELDRRDRERSQNLRVAARIQRHLLPRKPPSAPPFQLAVHFEPHDEVAGDYWDYQDLEDDGLGLVLADVSGHGVPAAFAAAMAKTTYKLRCHGVRSPQAVLRAMNEVLTDLLDEQFVTMLAARLDPRGRELVLARAGHPPPLLYRPGEGVRELSSDGMLLGVDPSASHPELRCPLFPGDRVVMYTDGLNESRDLRGNVLGTAALAEALEHHGAKPPEALLGELVRAAELHLGHLVFEDDVTAIVIAVEDER